MIPSQPVFSRSSPSPWARGDVDGELEVDLMVVALLVVELAVEFVVVVARCLIGIDVVAVAIGVELGA